MTDRIPVDVLHDRVFQRRQIPCSLNDLHELQLMLVQGESWLI